MNIHIHTSISEINQEQWKELVDNSPNTSFFQTPECYYFFASLSFLKPFVFGVSENDKLVGIVTGYVISDGIFVKKFFSRRAIVPGGLLLDASVSDGSIASLLNCFKKELKHRSIYIEMRNYTDYSDTRSAIEKSKFVYSPHLNFHVPTITLDDALKQLSTTKRRDIKLSKKAGAEWVETTDPSEIAAYYQILSDLYKTKVKTPLFPQEFFQKLALLPNGKIFVLKLENEIIGGSVCVLLPGKTLYEWFVCGLDGKYKNVFPSTLATWAAIEYSATNGIPRFDMMGAGKPDDGYGVREFKSKFGGELVEHGRFLYLNHPYLYKLGKYVINKYKSDKPKPKKEIAQISLYKIETTVEQTDFKAWGDFVKKHPHGNIFQTPQMFEIYENTPKFRPFVLIVKNENKQIVGCLIAVIQQQYNGILGILSARSIVNGGPLVDNDNPKIMDLILNKYNQLIKQNAILTQFRNSFDLLEFNDSFQKNGYNFKSHLNYIIDLTKGQEVVWKEISDGRKNKIKKAVKTGLSVTALEHNITDEQIDEGYNIIKMVYDRADLPLANKQLIVNAVKTNSIVLFLVKYEQQTIGCRFAFKYNDELYGWYAGSYTKYYSMFPNDLLIWETLKWGIENGYKSFDYGGAGNPNKHYGVRTFKAQTGGMLVNYGRYEKIHKPFLYEFAKMGFKFWQLFNR